MDDALGFFDDTKQLLRLIRRLSDAATIVHDGTMPVDLAAMPWEGRAAGALGEIAWLVTQQAGRARVRWDANDHRWVRDAAAVAKPTRRRSA